MSVGGARLIRGAARAGARGLAAIDESTAGRRHRQTHLPTGAVRVRVALRRRGTGPTTVCWFVRANVELTRRTIGRCSTCRVARRRRRSARANVEKAGVSTPRSVRSASALLLASGAAGGTIASTPAAAGAAGVCRARASCTARGGAARSTDPARRSCSAARRSLSIRAHGVRAAAGGDRSEDDEADNASDGGRHGSGRRSPGHRCSLHGSPVGPATANTPTARRATDTCNSWMSRCRASPGIGTPRTSTRTSPSDAGN